MPPQEDLEHESLKQARSLREWKLFIHQLLEQLEKKVGVQIEKQHKDKWVYLLFAFFDAFSSANSLKKLGEEIASSQINSKIIQHFMSSPVGIAMVAGESVFLVGFSVLGTYFDLTDEKKLKKQLADSWPYLRDVIKGLKNAYKGWRNLNPVLILLSGKDLKFLIIPIGIPLGLLAVSMRIWLRTIVESRKDMMKTLNDLAKNLKEEEESFRNQYLDEEKLKKLQDLYKRHLGLAQTENSSAKHFDLKKIKQSSSKRLQAFIAAGINSWLDSLYLYVGILGLAALQPMLLIPMVAVIALYGLSCFIVRLYEEYNFQIKLKIQRNQTELKLNSLLLESINKEAELLENKGTGKTPEEQRRLSLLQEESAQLQEKNERLRLKLEKQTRSSYLTKALMGMRYGLFLQGVVTSSLFLVSSIFLTGGTLPLAAVIVGICSGIASMLISASYLMIKHAWRTRRRSPPVSQEIPKLTSETSSATLIETLRCLVTGFIKGNNLSVFWENFFNSHTDSDSGEHVGTSVRHFVLQIIVSLSLGARAFVKGLRNIRLTSPLDSVGTHIFCEKNEPSNNSSTALESNISSPLEQPFHQMLPVFPASGTQRASNRAPEYVDAVITIEALTSPEGSPAETEAASMPTPRTWSGNEGSGTIPGPLPKGLSFFDGNRRAQSAGRRSSLPGSTDSLPRYSFTSPSSPCTPAKPGGCSTLNRPSPISPYTPKKPAALATSTRSAPSLRIGQCFS